MKVISTGNTFDIYPDDLKSFDKLPAGYYKICFQEMKGFYLEKYGEFSVNESKIYGQHLEKIGKVMKTFSKFNRSLGVILSGDKGIGKSLFSRCLGREVVGLGMPVIVVSTYHAGIASFIEKIDQEVMILFDEFDKTFGREKGGSDVNDPQTYMLSLFDGVSSGKKLFVITCNDIYKLNDYLVNRPGRFHYHFRFSYPYEDDIRSYLEDKLGKDSGEEINNVVAFSRKVKLNYDCLRSIAFELDEGNTFKEAINDLNIINLQEEKYRINVLFDDGSSATNKKVYMDIFSKEDVRTDLRNDSGSYVCEAVWNAKDMQYDPSIGVMKVEGKNVKLDYDGYYYDDEELAKKKKELKKKKIQYMEIIRLEDRNMHYAV